MKEEPVWVCSLGCQVWCLRQSYRLLFRRLMSSLIAQREGEKTRNRKLYFIRIVLERERETERQTDRQTDINLTFFAFYMFLILLLFCLFVCLFLF